MPNQFEREVKQRFETEGFKVLDRGWPDFLVERNGILHGIEIKRGGDVLSKVQRRMHAALAKIGLLVVTVKIKEEKTKRWHLTGDVCYEASREFFEKKKIGFSEFNGLGLS